MVKKCYSILDIKKSQKGFGKGIKKYTVGQWSPVMFILTDNKKLVTKALAGLNKGGCKK